MQGKYKEILAFWAPPQLPEHPQGLPDEIFQKFQKIR